MYNYLSIQFDIYVQQKGTNVHFYDLSKQNIEIFFD